MTDDTVSNNDRGWQVYQDGTVWVIGRQLAGAAQGVLEYWLKDANPADGPILQPRWAQRIFAFSTATTLQQDLNTKE